MTVTNEHVGLVAVHQGTSETGSNAQENTRSGSRALIVGAGNGGRQICTSDSPEVVASVTLATLPIAGAATRHRVSRVVRVSTATGKAVRLGCTPARRERPHSR